ncbi:MAG: fibronectin type III domain-containing protein [Actinomycetota bacterium]|nr:fibronectin type III domain-containing protein [Actinomycetota bacterium]
MHVASSTVPSRRRTRGAAVLAAIAVLLGAAGALTGLFGSPAGAAVSCTYDGVSTSPTYQQLTIEIPAGESLTITRDPASNEFHVSPVAPDGSTRSCGASVDNVKTVVVTAVPDGTSGAPGDETVTIDLSNGQFAPGVSEVGEQSLTPEIEFYVDLGGGAGDSLVLNGSAGPETVRVGEHGEIDPNGDGDLDIFARSTTAAPDTATIENFTINGNGDNDDIGVLGTAAPALLVNGGAGNDAISGGTGNDTLTGGDGNDSVTGGAGNDSVTGGAGDDTIDGGDGADATSDAATTALDGGDGNDTITGGAGGDEISGGAGNDTITGDDASDTTGSPDILNGGTGTDTIAGGAGDDTIDGGDDADATSDPATTALNGGDGNDTITGGAGGDEISGGAGNDTITGGAGGDDISGGADDDTITGDDASDTTGSPDILQGDAGNDTINGGAGNDAIDGGDDADATSDPATTALNGGGGNDTITGGAGGDELSGGPGDDTEDGGAGDDTFGQEAAANGGDILIGGDGTGDLVDYSTRTSDLSVSLDGAANDGQASPAENDDVAIDVENVSGGAGNDTITGNGSANILRGGGGNDSLTGLGGDDDLLGDAGADTLNGGLGADELNGGTENDQLFGSDDNDTLTGGAGSDTENGGAGEDELEQENQANGGDTLIGGPGSDTVDYSGRTNAVTVHASDNNANDGEAAEGDNVGREFHDIENITGGKGNDSLTGTGAANVISGGAGDDTESGLGGDDTFTEGTTANGSDSLNGGDGTGDLVDYSTRSTSLVVTIDGTSGDGELGENDNVAVDVENLNGGSGNDTITGSSSANTLTGNAGTDTLNGGTGDDTFKEGSAPNGADTLNGDSPLGAIVGGGNDTVDYSARTSAVTVDLDGNADDGDADEKDNVSTDVENVKGGSGRDTITGSASANTLTGNGGTDTLNGGAGADVLNGNIGSDSLNGDDGDDLLNGGSGDDTMVNGGAGNDTLNGDAGNDTLRGGPGNDTENGGTGDDRFDEEGPGANGADTFNGGTETDTVDYSARTSAVSITRDGTANDGDTNEGDNVGNDVELPVTPQAPTGVTATAGNASATVSWTAPVDNGGSAITSYVVSATSSDGGTVPAATTVTGTPPATTTNVAGLTNGKSYTFTVKAANAAGEGAASAASTAVTPGAPGEFHPLPPARILDTRTGTGTGGVKTKVEPGSTTNVTVVGQGGVPATGVSAVVMNVTVTQPTAPRSFLTVFPKGAPKPEASSLNFVAGQDVPNLVKAKVGADGQVSVYNAEGSTHVIFDVVGWYSDQTGPSGTRYNALSPERILDTRGGIGGFNSKVGAGGKIDVPIAGRGGVPASGVSAVVMNVTATQPTAPRSYLTVYPKGQPLPIASNLNFVAGEDVPNLVVAKVGADGSVSVYNEAGSTHVIFDVVGYFGAEGASTGKAFTSLVPSRILDTRTGDGTGTPGVKVAQGKSIDVAVLGKGRVPPTGVSAVVLNVTVTQPTAPLSFLTVYPTGEPRPEASNLNFVADEDVANLVIAKVGADGKVSVYNDAGSTHVIFDVVGYMG